MTHAFMFYLISSCCLRRQKVFHLRVEFTIYIYGKTGHSGWKIKWFVSFHLGSFREDLRRSNAFVLFLVCSADLDIICCGSFSNFIVHHFRRDHPPPSPQPNFSLPLFPVFFSFKNTVVPREIQNNDHGRTFWGVNKILYAVGKIVNSFIYVQDFHPAAGGLCEW